MSQGLYKSQGLRPLNTNPQHERKNDTDMGTAGPTEIKPNS
jgi:hypothetical protein